jgi:hypothetical protein
LKSTRSIDETLAQIDGCRCARLSEIDQGAIVDNKRLDHVLEIAQRVQRGDEDLARIFS